MTKQLRVLVCGGRDYADAATVWRELDKLRLAHHGDMLIIHGNARGADRMACFWCLDRRVPIHPYPAQWARHGRGAGPIRNQRMLDEGKPDLVIAFPGGRGTADMVERARVAGIKIIEVGGTPR